MDRELRVAALKRSTFWLRVVAALVSLAIGGGILLLSLAGVFPTATFGRRSVQHANLARARSRLVGGAILYLGQPERRKARRHARLTIPHRPARLRRGGRQAFLATSLRGFHALLAIFPILAVTLLMGGVTGARCWETTLALVNALFCSLAAGLAVSAISRDPQKAMAARSFFYCCGSAGGPLADGILAAVKGHGSRRILSLASPFYVFRTAAAWGRRTLLDCAAHHPRCRVAPVLGWPPCWFRAPGRNGPSRQRFPVQAGLMPGGTAGPAPRHASPQAHRPEPGFMARLPRALAIAGGLGDGGPGSRRVRAPAAGGPAGEMGRLEVAELVFIWLLYLWTASQACRFFIEARRSGLIELLLAAPVSVRDIVQGQWRALLRLVRAGGLAAGRAVGGRVFRRERRWTGGCPWAGSYTLATTLVGSAPASLPGQPRGDKLVWHVDGHDLEEQQPRHAENPRLRAGHPGVRYHLRLRSALPLLILPLVIKGGLPRPTPAPGRPPS